MVRAAAKNYNDVTVITSSSLNIMNLLMKLIKFKGSNLSGF